MLSNLVSVTVNTGQSVVTQIDGNLIEYLGGQTVSVTAWDAITLRSAGIVT